MPNPVSATPEMVETLGNLEEVELTREGVRPWSPRSATASWVRWGINMCIRGLLKVGRFSGAY
jgi:hypothetical protein